MLRHKSQLQLLPMQLRYQHPNLRSNSSHLFNHRCLSNNRRRRHILNKIQLSIFQSQRPLSSFTPNQREGIMSFFTVLFRTLDFYMYIPFSFYFALFHFVSDFTLSTLVLFHLYIFTFYISTLPFYSYFYKRKQPRRKGEISYLIFLIRFSNRIRL